MKFCPFCGAKVVHEQAKFCAECGQVLNSSENTQGIARKTESVKDAISKTADNVSSAVRQYFQSDSGTVSQKLESAAAALPKINLFGGNSKNNRKTSQIEKELAECRRYAEEGYQLAKGEYDKIKNTLQDEKQRLSSTNREQNKLSRIQNAEILKQQDKEWDSLSTYVDGIQSDIEMLRENQKDFSIIIYGRTMAGKSTLMEILTHGNGQSIGKGAQRTTLDVRSYYWQGMKITDVPGICSFGGAEDDKLAMEAAKSADLILFLLTDDAPQAGEADCLAQLKQLGKPVLGVVNVKMSFDISRKKLALRNLQNKLSDTKRIDSICEQFKDFAQKHQQDWSDIPFVYTHLNAAFQAQPERANDTEVYATSNFPQVEEFILEKVRRDGKFLRMKNFIDITAVPMQKIIHTTYEHSANAILESATYVDKILQLYDWREKFLERSQKKLDRFYKDIYAEIDKEIYTFAEYNYENENAGMDWEITVNKMDLPGRCQKLLEAFGKECEHKRKELSDELTQELRFRFGGMTRLEIELNDTTEWGKYAGWALNVASFFVPGGIVVKLAVGLGGVLLACFSDGKEKKIQESKEKMRQALAEGTYPKLDDMHNKVVDIFNNEILGKGVDGFTEVLEEMRCSLIRLGKAQGELARALCVNFRNLNLKLLEEAAKYKGIPVKKVYETARIPGERFLVVSDDWSGDTKGISSLLGEQLDVLPNRDVLRIVLGTESESVNLPLSSKENAQTTTVLETKNKVHAKSLALAQQISKLPIVAETV